MEHRRAFMTPRRCLWNGVCAAGVGAPTIVGVFALMIQLYVQYQALFVPAQARHLCCLAGRSATCIGLISVFVHPEYATTGRCATDL